MWFVFPGLRVVLNKRNCRRQWLRLPIDCWWIVDPYCLFSFVCMFWLAVVFLVDDWMTAYTLRGVCCLATWGCWRPWSVFGTAYDVTFVSFMSFWCHRRHWGVLWLFGVATAYWHGVVLLACRRLVIGLVLALYVMRGLWDGLCCASFCWSSLC